MKVSQEGFFIHGAPTKGVLMSAGKPLKNPRVLACPGKPGKITLLAQKPPAEGTLKVNDEN